MLRLGLLFASPGASLCGQSGRGGSGATHTTHTARRKFILVGEPKPPGEKTDSGHTETQRERRVSSFALKNLSARGELE